MYPNSVYAEDLKLTKRQEEVLGVIKSHYSRTGIPPTVRDIGEELGITVNGVIGHLNALEWKGCIRRMKNHARGIVVL